MKSSLIYLLSGVLLFSVFGCGDSGAANPSSPKRQVYFYFFNDIRQEIGALEEQYSRLANFTANTKTFLESREAQKTYVIGSFYFEKGLDRERGAINYADRFADDGIVVLVAIYTEREKEIYTARLEKNERSVGKQVGQNYVFYQAFTAKPRDEELEKKINNIIARQIEAHAATIAQPID
jgi:hypothetical protein